MKSLREQIAGQCVHFCGIQHKHCKAGVELVSVRDSSQPGPYRWPCLTIDGRAATTVCAQRRMPTPDEVEAEARGWEQLLDDVDKGNALPPGVTVHSCNPSEEP